MTEKQFLKIQNTIKDTIKVEVNGKIDRINIKLDDYIKNDELWKEAAKPVIAMGVSMQGFGRVTLYIVGFIAAVGGAFMFINNFLKNH